MIIGIDPGVGGAIAVLVENDIPGLWDMPTMKKGKTGNSRELNCYELHRLLETAKSEKPTVILENVHAMPKNGSMACFSLGHTFGGIKGVIASLGYTLHLVEPRTWKKYFKLPKDKEASRSLAIRLNPHVSHQLARKKDCDRAEALLIARYGKEVLVK